MERFEDYVKRVRAQAGLTQLELSHRIGCSSSYIGRMETGSSLPSEPRCIRIAEATATDARVILQLRQYWKSSPESRALLMNDGDQAPAAAEPSHRGADAAEERDVPVLNRVRCGAFLDSTDLDYPAGFADRYVRMATRFPNAFFVEAEGDSMTGGRIYEGDLLLVEPELEPQSGDIVLAKTAQGATVKKLIRKSRQIVLQPLNPNYDPIFLGPADDVVCYRITRIVAPTGPELQVRESRGEAVSLEDMRERILQEVNALTVERNRLEAERTRLVDELERIKRMVDQIDFGALRRSTSGKGEARR
ncbi:MAG: helix-turn-helix domain-containing protein [Myxococcales bacterium]|nr:helix-turn-helix domain-containing protein [Myxococcales bacterium]